MCMGGDTPPPPPPPAPPPPPPPVLEQDAPKKAAPSVGEQQSAKALGTKKFRTSLEIGAADNQAGNTGLSISQ